MHLLQHPWLMVTVAKNSLIETTGTATKSSASSSPSSSFSSLSSFAPIQRSTPTKTNHNRQTKDDAYFDESFDVHDHTTGSNASNQSSSEIDSDIEEGMFTPPER